MTVEAVESFDDDNIRFIDETERQQYREAMLGENVRDFLVSAVGAYMHTRAKEDIEACKDALMTLDPHKEEDRKEWDRQKIKAGAARNFMNWCAEAIINGESAYQMLEDDNQE